MGKKQFKLNPVDVIIVLVIVAAIAIVGGRLFSKNELGQPDETFRVSFFCEDVPSYIAEVMETGDAVTDDDRKVELGTVEKVTLGPSRTYAATAEGELKLAPKEGANSVEVVAKVTAKDFEHGFSVDIVRYSVGHSLTLSVGKAKIYGRVSGIEKLSE